MKIKVKIMLENLTTEKIELANYLVDCLAQREFGKNIEITTNPKTADIFIDLKDLKTKEQIFHSLTIISITITEKLLEKRPILQRGQKKIRRKINKK